MNTKIFLSIETSLNRIYLVVFKKNKTYFLSKNKVVSIEIDLNILIKKIMKRAGIDFYDLDFIAVSLGPGSFTGTRVGISAAKAIAITIGKKIIGLSNFDTLYYSALKENKNISDLDVEIIIKSNRHSFYSQTINTNLRRKKTKALQHISLNKEYKKSVMKIGNFENIYELENFKECWPSADGYLKSINKIWQVIDLEKSLSLDPIYIKEHYAAAKK